MTSRAKELYLEHLSERKWAAINEQMNATLAPFGDGEEVFCVMDEDGTSRPPKDWREWTERFEGVGHSIANTRVGRMRVSTVHLGTNLFGTPFETMIFGGPLDLWQRRYATYEEADLGHWLTVRALRYYFSPHAPPKSSILTQTYYSWLGDPLT